MACVILLAALSLLSACAAPKKLAEEPQGSASILDKEGGPKARALDGASTPESDRVKDAGIKGGDAVQKQCAAFAQRLTYKDVALTQSLHKESHVILAPKASGGSFVAWLDTGSSVHVTTLNQNDERAKEDFITTGPVLRAATVREDNIALYTMSRADRNSTSNSGWLIELGPDGTENFKQLLTIKDQSSPVVISRAWDSGAILWTGTQYAVYVAIHSKDGHEGDMLQYVNTQGQAVKQIWSWGCSHSGEQKLAVGAREVLAAICDGDAYPKGVAGSLVTAAGSKISNKVVFNAEPASNGRGGFAGVELGEVIAVGDSFFHVFSSKEGRPGGRHDIALLQIDNRGKAANKIWLTNTEDDEIKPHLAKYGSHFLVAWELQKKLVFSVIDSSGAVVEGPIAADALIRSRDDFATFADGDVGWAAAVGATTLRIYRLQNCTP
jgi:hypothetical protein